MKKASCHIPVDCPIHLFGQCAICFRQWADKRKNYMGYMIKIFYRYPATAMAIDSFFKCVMIVHEPINPFTMSPTGLSKKKTH